MQYQITNVPHLFEQNKNTFNEILKIVSSILNTKLESSVVNNLIALISENKFADFVELDAKEINKQTIIDLQSMLLISDLCGYGIKFYYIKNYDFASIQIQNSLLKFVEEPPLNTYAFFSATDLNRVLKTIISRCVVHKNYSIINNNPWLTNNNSLELGVANLYQSLLYVDDVKKFIDQFKKLDYKQINNFLELIFDKQNFKFSNEILQIKEDVKLNLNKNLLAFKLIKLKGL